MAADCFSEMIRYDVPWRVHPSTARKQQSKVKHFLAIQSDRQHLTFFGLYNGLSSFHAVVGPRDSIWRFRRNIPCNCAKNALNAFSSIYIFVGFKDRWRERHFLLLFRYNLKGGLWHYSVFELDTDFWAANLARAGCYFWAESPDLARKRCRWTGEKYEVPLAHSMYRDRLIHGPQVTRMFSAS